MFNPMVMLKSLGLDPEKIIGTVDQMGKMISDLHARQVRTEAMIAAIYRAQFGADYNDGHDTRPAGDNAGTIGDVAGQSNGAGNNAVQ